MPPTDLPAFCAPGVPTYDDAPLIVGPIADARPFPRDLTHVVSTEPSSCDRLAYYPLPLSLLHPRRPGFYFTGDTAHRTDEGDTLTFDREWCTIPRSRTQPLGSYPYLYPALIPVAASSPKTITAMLPVRGNISILPAPVFTVAGHGLAVGTLLAAALTYASGPYTLTAPLRIISTTTDTITTTPFTLYLGPDGSLDFGNFSSGTLTPIAPGRTSPRTLTTSAVESYDYALPGVTPGIATDADFRAAPSSRPLVTASQEETDSINTLTTPTAADYHAQIVKGALLVAESIVRPYRGEILERRTILVPAL